MFCVYAEITGQGFGFFSGYLTKEGNISDQMLLGEDPEEGKAEGRAGRAGRGRDPRGVEGGGRSVPAYVAAATDVAAVADPGRGL
jgi:hypothetical protein